MLLLQQRVRTLKRLQALELSHLRWLDRRFPTRPSQRPSRISLRHRDSMKGWISKASATACTSTPSS